MGKEKKKKTWSGGLTAGEDGTLAKNETGRRSPSEQGKENAENRTERGEKLTHLQLQQHMLLLFDANSKQPKEREDQRDEKEKPQKRREERRTSRGGIFVTPFPSLREIQGTT